MVLNQQLVTLREQKGLTQAAVGKAMGVSQSCVAKMESKRDDDLTVGWLRRYASAVGSQVQIKVA